MANFTVQVLKANELGEAWPIVRAGPYPNVDWWICEAVELIENGGGVLVARATHLRVNGVATFQVPSNETEERVLRIPLLISFELTRSAPARFALLKSLERIATKLECSHVTLPLAAKAPVRSSERCVALAY